MRTMRIAYRSIVKQREAGRKGRLNQPDWTTAVDLLLSEVEGADEREAERRLLAQGFTISDSTIRRWRELRAVGEAIAKPRNPAKDSLLRFLKQKTSAGLIEGRGEGRFFPSLLSEAGRTTHPAAADARAREMTGVLNRLVWKGKLSPPDAIEFAWEIAEDDQYDEPNREYVRYWEGLIRSAMERPNEGRSAPGATQGGSNTHR